MHNGEKQNTRISGRFHEEKGYLLYSHGDTIYSRKSVKFPIEASKLDIANMMLLSKHLLPNTNVIGYRTNRGTKPMGVDRLGKVVGTQDRQTRRFISKMERLHLMKRVKVNTVDSFHRVSESIQYIINPLYFFNGKKLSIFLYYTFMENLDAHLPKKIQEKYKQRLENCGGKW